ncbi:MAG: TolC family protein, partial [Gemmatimonadota bacterium]
MQPEKSHTAVLLAAVVLAGLGAAPGTAQAPRHLEEALAMAEHGAFAVRIAEGEATERSAGALEALGGILPTLRVESGLSRTTDPIGAFGTTLRQRAITQADFNPATLNHPAVAEDWSGALVAEVPLVNADAWLGRRAAGDATAAARAMVDWERLSTRAQVVRAWFGATLAGEKVRTLEEAARAARAHVKQAELMVEQGLVTRSDALLASVKAGQVDAMLAEARGEARSARRGLATLLGRPDLDVAVPEQLPPAAAVRELALDLSGPVGAGMEAARADVRAAHLGLDAAAGDVLRTRAAWLPRLNGMARMEWHAVDGPLGVARKRACRVMVGAGLA